MSKLDLNKKNILITGGAGFIGSNLVKYIQEKFPQSFIYVFDKFQSEDRFPSGNHLALGSFKNLIGFKGNVISGDINNTDDLELLENINWDLIFHQAAISDTTVLNQSLVIKTNTNTLRHFILLAEKCNAKLIYASSAGVYGNTEAPNCIGAGEIPENVYGFSKLMMDNLTRTYLSNSPKIEIVGLRYFNVYGNGEFNKGKTSSMILQLGLQILNGSNPKLFKYGDQKRDFVFIDDVIQANILSINADSGIYNVGSGVARTFNDIIENLKKQLGVEFEVEYIDNPFTFYQNNTQADISLTTEKLGYKPAFLLESGIEKYISEIKYIHQNFK
jgi:ADP-L-glycero-D-manno-heptose 6-epimerase